MRIGLFPGQAHALREIVKEERRRERRRGFLLAGAAAVVSGSAMWLVGGARGNPSSPEQGSLPRDASGSVGAGVPVAEALAVGPIAELRRQAMEWAAALEADPNNTRLWLGFHRLVALALSNPNDEVLRRRLNVLATLSGAPDHAVEAARLLRLDRKK